MPRHGWSFNIRCTYSYPGPEPYTSGPDFLLVMKKTIFFLVLLSFGFDSAAQTIRFSKYYDLSNSEVNFPGAVEVLPQGYALLSYDHCTGVSFCTILAITDTLGEVLQQKTFRGLTLEGLRYHPEDSTFLLWGRFPVGNQDDAPCMLKINYQGDTLWSFSLNPPDVDFGHNTLELPDKSILLTTAPQFWSGNQATIIKTDSTGHLLWIKGYDTGNYFKSYDVQGLLAWKDSTVLFCATGRNTIVHNDDPYDSGVSLFQIDYDGNLLHDTAYNIDQTLNLDGHARLASIAGDRIVTSSDTDLFDPLNSGTNLLAINMGDKSIDWTLGFSESLGHAIISQLYTTLDGGIVACGRTYTTVFPNVLPTAWLLKTSAEGQVEWERFLPRSMGLRTTDIKPTPDGGYIVLGNYDDPDYYSYIMLIKIDGHGCLQPNCDSLLLTTAVGEPMPGETLPVLKIQPSPGDDLVAVNTTEYDAGWIRMVDMLGYIVAEVPVIGEKTILPVNMCANGIYTVQYLDAKGIVQAIGRSVVQH